MGVGKLKKFLSAGGTRRIVHSATEQERLPLASTPILKMTGFDDPPKY